MQMNLRCQYQTSDKKMNDKVSYLGIFYNPFYGLYDSEEFPLILIYNHSINCRFYNIYLMQENVKHYEDQENMKLSDHEINICQRSKKKISHDVSKRALRPYVFKICGETYHVISENLPESSERKRFLHLYK